MPTYNPLSGGSSNSGSTRRRQTRTPAQRAAAARAYGQSQANRSGGRDIATSAGRSTTSSGYGQYNTSPRDYYWGNAQASQYGTTQGYQGFREGVRAAGGMSSLLNPSPGGGGGGRGYGGGGGGGGGGLTQAMLDQMLGALGAQGPALNLSTVDLPDFQGANLPAFNPAVYDQATGQLREALAQDTANINTATQNTTSALQNNYSNAYANANVRGAPAAQPMGTALQGTAGGGGQGAQVAQETNAAGASDQASFQNLLAVLGAADQTSQNSRMNEVALNQQTALQGVGAQNRALSGQIGMARTQAQQQWAQQDAERRYQNSLMGQQWNREEMMRNQDITNQNTQGNWQQRNEMISSRLGPLLELLGSSNGRNLGGVQALLQQWQRP